MASPRALDPPRPPQRPHRRPDPAAPGPASEPRARRRLVELWADLLTAVPQAASALLISQDELADDIPLDLVAPVNLELRQRGSSYQVNRSSLRKAAAPRPPCSPSPASDAADLHRCG
ncbi:MAG: hypothetical protein VKI81_06405 [Synechococcaceae cyanobacterium]|nr:hypothetical protein [Synechococcaceae cyanobacterium]